jgi:hypothetical protein
MEREVFQTVRSHRAVHLAGSARNTKEHTTWFPYFQDPTCHEVQLAGLPRRKMARQRFSVIPYKTEMHRGTNPTRQISAYAAWHIQGLNAPNARTTRELNKTVGQAADPRYGCLVIRCCEVRARSVALYMGCKSTG